jgi:hypothetical protein
MENGVGGQQRRKRRPQDEGASARVATATIERDAPPASGRGGERRARSAARDEAARAALAPLEPGERPRPLLVAIVLCALLGAANAIAFAAGAKINGGHPGPGVLAFTAVMAFLAGGMWLRRYLAVLAFEALLALTVLAFTLFLVEASNLEAVALCVAVIAGGGFLFWKLVRVMGRMATPPQSSSA